MHKRTLFPLLLVIYEIVLYLSNDAYLPALPQLTIDLNSTHHLAQLSLTTWFLGASSMQLFLGPLSDRVGRRPVLLSGAGIFILTAIICMQTTSMTTMLITRFIQGATVTSMTVPGYAAIHEYFERKQAIQTLAWMNAVTVLAPAFGPLFGSLILFMADWRWIFGVLALGAFLSLISLYFKLPETNTNKHQINIKTIARHYLNIICNKEYICNIWSLCALFGAMIAWIAAGPFLVMTKFNYSAFVFGAYQAMIFIWFLLGTRLVKPLMEKYPLKKLVSVGIAMALCGALTSMILAILFPKFLLGMVISLMFVSCGSGLCFPILNRLGIEASTEPMGARMAIFSTSMTAMAAIASGLISSVYDGSLLSLSYILLVFTCVPIVLLMRV